MQGRKSSRREHSRKTDDRRHHSSDNRHSFINQETRRDKSSRDYHDRRREESHHKRKRENPFKSESTEAHDYGKPGDGDKKEGETKDKEKPNFETTGNLAADTNTFNGVVIKYNEPPEARKARTRWRLYPFKGDKALPVLQIHRQSAYLLGRDRLVADIPIHHPSCSKQHAVLQYRIVEYVRNDGSKGKRVRPFIIDLESSNGTFVNNQKIETKRYVELLEKDMIKFGYSSREYVLLHEESKEDDPDVVDDNSNSPQNE